MYLLKNLNKWGGVILLLAMFVMFNSEARAVVKTVNMNIGGCQYFVYIDYECSITAPITTSYRIVRYEKADTNCVSTLPFDSVPSAMYVLIESDLGYWISECTSYYKPCYLGWSKVKAIEYTCWTYWGGGANFVPCENSKECVTITDYCFNGIELVKGTSITTGTPSTQAECDSVSYCTGAIPVKTKCD